MKKFLILIFIALILGVAIFFLKTRENSTYTTTGYEGVPVTNSWISSLFYDRYSKPLFAMPGSYKITQNGLEIGKPNLVFKPTSIFYTHRADIFLNFESGEKVVNKKIEDIGEGDVRFKLVDKDENFFEVHIIKGSPVLYFRNPSSKLVLSVNSGNVTKSDRGYLIEIGKTKFLVSGGSLINGKLIFDASVSSNFVAILPDEPTANHLELYNCAINEPEKVDYSFSDKNINFTYATQKLFPKNYLISVWPHQKANYPVLGNYATNKGELSLVCANNLNLFLDSADLPLDWDEFLNTSLVNSHDARRYFMEDIDGMEKEIYPQGVYFKGKYIKNYVDLWELARIMGQKDIVDKLEQKIKGLLMRELNNFYLDEKTGLVLSKTPEFGNETGNDHHFQYSYYIYSYSKLFSKFSASEQENIRNLMEMLLNEGMPGIRGVSKYPLKFRFLDVVEGHSWADGRALFEDGNDQESSSEALFYWYCWYLWGRTISDTKISTWAKFAYYIELSGQKAYWFLDGNEFLQNSFQKPIGVLIWGGKTDYATWFSPSEDKIFGIEVLPPNPSSMVSLRMSNSNFTRIMGYYDKLFGDDPARDNSFGNYYLFFKKVNGNHISLSKTPFKDEFVSQTLLYLLK